MASLKIDFGKLSLSDDTRKSMKCVKISGAVCDKKTNTAALRLHDEEQYC